MADAVAAADARRAARRSRCCSSSRCGCARTVFPATWDAQQRAGEVAGVVDEAVTGVRVVKGFGQEERELRPPGRRRRRPVPVARPAGPAPGPVHADAAVDPGARPGRRARLRRLAGDRRPHHARHVPRVLVVPRAARRAGADVRHAARRRPAGPGRRRAHPRPARRQPARRRARPTPSTLGPVARRGPLRRRPLRLHAAATPVLDGFDLHVAPGETVALVGASGSGKSTVAAAAARASTTSSPGAVTIDGVDVRDVTLDSLRRQVGVVFEEAFLFSDSVRANIAYGRPDATDDEVEAAARRPRPTSSSRAARRLRHRRRRARPHAVGRPAPAHRPRPGAAHRPADPDPRRRHLVGRRRDRGGDPRHAALSVMAGAHDDPRRPPPLDAAPRRPHRRRRRRPGRRRGHPRGAAGPLRALPRRCSPGPATTCEVARDRRVRGRVGRRRRRGRRSTPAAWPHERRRRRRPGGRRPRPPAAGATRAAGGRRRRGGGRHDGARRPRPSCSPRSAKLPPADDDPDVDVDAESAAPPSAFRAARASCARTAAGSAVGLALVVARHRAHAARPVPRPPRHRPRRAARATRRALWLAVAGASSSWRSSTGS